MKLSLILFIFFVFNFAFAQAKREYIIGCAYTCDSYTKEALAHTSHSLAMKLKIIDLSVTKKVQWTELDGVIIPGGADIDPKYYLQHVGAELQEHIKSLDHLVEYTHEGAERDPFEYAMLRDYFNNPTLTDFPLLGLCRGMQIMTVALEIPLYVDIKDELGIENRRDLYDQIEVVDSNSLMANLFPFMSFSAYKYHHQGLRVSYFKKNRERWPNIKITAFSNQGKIAESLELLNRPALGVQFHPEVDNDSVRKAIFTWFLTKVQNRKQLSTK